MAMNTLRHMGPLAAIVAFTAAPVFAAGPA
jgi:hypothetical protein